MKTKLAKSASPYITAEKDIFKIFNQHFSKKFTPAFSTDIAYSSY